MDLSDDLPPPRRSLFFPVVIATVFLAIIGMSAGLALASWHKGQNQGNQAQGDGTATTAPATAKPAADACPPQAQEIAEQKGNAQGTLRVQLVLTTKFSTIWICRDDAGQLFYQANRGGEHATWIEGTTALFLPGVKSDGDGGYVVGADQGRTQFQISSTQLVIVHKDGTREVQPAV